MSENTLTAIVTLGPLADLHRGVHHTLMNNPPCGFQYTASQAEHVFLFPQEGVCTCPYHCPHWVELVRFARAGQVVHSYHWPVFDHRSWVTEISDCGYSLFGGRHSFDLSFRACFRKPWGASYRRHILCRARNMLTAFSHPSCKALLFNNRFALSETSRWIGTLGLQQEGEAALAKASVVYSAQVACPESALRKWGTNVPPLVVFSGWDFDTKNGQIALDVFSSIARNMPTVHFIYVGTIPDSAKYDRRSLAGRMEHFSSLPRQELLGIFERAHILFHPSRFEGLANVLVEAAANGMAVIVALGGGMEATTELFDGGGALFLDRDRVPQQEEPLVFEALLRRLLDDSDLRRSLGVYNHTNARSGPLSLKKRDEVLGNIYDRACSDPAKSVLAVGDLPYAQFCRVVISDTDRVHQQAKVFREEKRLGQERVLI
jgi:glycosyltransferase involved in cell wall biosynthesis